MKRIFTAAVVTLLLTTPLPAGEKEAREILERAIKAHGGAEALQKALVCKRNDTGTQVIVGKEIPFVSRVMRSLPDRVRLEVVLDRKFSTTIVIDGDKGWQAEGKGPANPLPPQRVREMREEAYVWWISTLVPLQKGGFTLDSLPETKVEGETATGIKVSRKGHADTTLYFSKRDGLLLRIDRKAIEAGVEVSKEYVYAGHKEQDGVTLPTKETVRINGKKWTEFTISGYSFPAKLDATTFSKP